jgi:hypothetical protein
VREEVDPEVATERRGQGLTTADLAGGAQQESRTALFAGDEANGFRTQWNEVQTAFVDDPRTSVQRADALVAQVMQRLAQVFSEERKNLEAQWERGGDVSTEDLRVALQRYRSFFARLLSV